MKRIKFTKMVASGNDFVVLEHSRGLRNLKGLAKEVCDRKYGIGADGLLLLKKMSKATSMRIFNADGSEAEMCGNGARCAALYANLENGRLSTLAGVIDTAVDGNQVRIRLTDPKEVKLGFPLRLNGMVIKANFINTGVPHTVIFVEGLDNFDVETIGRMIRRHSRFAPRGTNVNFAETLSKNLLRIRTYERGVEAETLACGTGSTASALIFALMKNEDNLVKVRTQSGEILKVYFKKYKNSLKDVWLEGGARIVYRGEYYV